MSEGFDDETRRLINRLTQELEQALTKEAAQILGKLIMWLAISTMIRLKAAEEVLLVYHNDCGAAAAVGLESDEILQIHLDWQQRIQASFPSLKVRVLEETHSLCGNHHHGHEERQAA